MLLSLNSKQLYLAIYFNGSAFICYSKLIPLTGRCKMWVTYHITEYNKCKAFQNNTSLGDVSFFNCFLHGNENDFRQENSVVLFRMLNNIHFRKGMSVIYITVIKICLSCWLVRISHSRYLPCVFISVKLPIKNECTLTKTCIATGSRIKFSFGWCVVVF